MRQAAILERRSVSRSAVPVWFRGWAIRRFRSAASLWADSSPDRFDHPAGPGAALGLSDQRQGAKLAALRRGNVCACGVFEDGAGELSGRVRNRCRGHCSISATVTGAEGQDVPWGDVAPRTVTFTNGISSAISFTAPRQNASVGAYDVVIDWRAVSCQTQTGSIGAIPIGSTRHRIYSLFAQPVAPMDTPWAKVLEMSSQMLASMSPSSTAENAVAAIADGIFYSRWTEYSIKFYSPFRPYQYDPSKRWSCGTVEAERFRLQDVLNEISDSNQGLPVRMQCNENSNLHAILAASQGITASPTLILDTRSTLLTQTALYHPAGPEAECRQDRFTFHQVSSLDFLYDTSAQAATGSVNSCTPGANVFGLTQAAYLPVVFPMQPAEFTSFTRPTVEVGSCHYRKGRID